MHPKNSLRARGVRLWRTIRRRFREGVVLALNWRNSLALRVIQWIPPHHRNKALKYLPPAWFLSPKTSPHQVVGRCIYCGCTKHLTDEHAMPAGFSGDRVLFKASCDVCKKKIDL